MIIKLAFMPREVVVNVPCHHCGESKRLTEEIPAAAMAMAGMINVLLTRFGVKGGVIESPEIPGYYVCGDCVEANTEDVDDTFNAAEFDAANAEGGG